MWQTIVLSLLAGVMGANAFPHFARGVTRERYPCKLGNGPVPNLIAGWAGLLITALLAWWAHPSSHPAWSLAAGATGVLLLGLFHAGPGAFGRPETPNPAAGASGG